MTRWPSAAIFRRGYSRWRPERIPRRFHNAVTDWCFVLEGVLSVETRAPRDRQVLTIGGSYTIPPKTAHLIVNESQSDTRFLLVQGVGGYDFVAVGGP